MEIVQGGYSSIEVASDENFTNAKTITRLLKSGTGMQPETDVVESADGKKPSVMKKLVIGIRSADVDNGVDAPYTFIREAEESHSLLFFRFRTIGGRIIIIKNVLVAVVCEMNAIGKACAIRVSGVVMGITEDAIFKYRFSRLRIDSIHYLKIDQTHFLRI